MKPFRSYFFGSGFAAGLVLLLAVVGNLQAVPDLQLGIPGATYDATFGVESSISSSPVFDLVALLKVAGNVNTPAPSKDFYLSIALDGPSAPSIGSTPSAFGSFTLDGVGPFDNSSPWTYGRPFPSPDDQLQTHGIFDTWYMLLGPFHFDTAKKANWGDLSGADANNVQLDADGPLTPSSTGALYYETWAFNTTSLLDNVDLHFDLFAAEEVTKHDVTTLTITDFAPFSHDAQSGSSSSSGSGSGSGSSGSGGSSVPDGSATLLLLGIACAGIEGAKRYFRK